MQDVESNFIKNFQWIAIDTETTGTNPWKHEIIEIGAVKFTLEKEVDTFEVLIKPLKKQDPKSREIHNISNEELEEKGGDLHDVLQTFIDFIGEEPLIFHNAPFDLSFITKSAADCKLELKANFYYDTLYLFRNYFPGRKSYSLANLTKDFNISTNTFHRALNDAMATSKLFCHLLESNLDLVSSNKKLKNFLRFHRKVNAFQTDIPKNLDTIINYFNKHISKKSMIKIKYKNPQGRFVTSIVTPFEILIINQKLLLKAKLHLNGEQFLIPLKEAVVFDPDIGPMPIY